MEGEIQLIYKFYPSDYNVRNWSLRTDILFRNEFIKQRISFSNYNTFNETTQIFGSFKNCHISFSKINFLLLLLQILRDFMYCQIRNISSLSFAVVSQCFMKCLFQKGVKWRTCRYSEVFVANKTGSCGYFNIVHVMHIDKIHFITPTICTYQHTYITLTHSYMFQRTAIIREPL